MKQMQVRVAVRNDTILLKGICPYCKKEHIHGGGDVGEEPTIFLGHRQSHCGGNDGYNLVFPKE